MNTLIKKIESRGNFVASRICISQTPKHVFGLQFLLHTRILFFKESGEQFHIDFNTQKIYSNNIYIIPPFHFQHISKTISKDFVCVDIENSLLKSHHKRLLYLIKYKLQKSLTYPNTETGYTYDSLLELANSHYSEELILELIVGWIEKCISEETKQKKKRTSSRTIIDADHFISLLSEKNLSFDAFKVNKLALEMFSSERNLHRICTNVFGKSAKDIINYHITAQAIFLLSASTSTITEISNELNFSSPTAFARYLRLVSGYTPSEIRELMTESGL